MKDLNGIEILLQSFRNMISRFTMFLERKRNEKKRQNDANRKLINKLKKIEFFSSKK